MTLKKVGLFSQGANDGKLCFHEGAKDAQRLCAILDESVEGGPFRAFAAYVEIPETEAKEG